MNILIICNNTTDLVGFRDMLIKRFLKDGNFVTAIVPEDDSSSEEENRYYLADIGCDVISIPIERRKKNVFHDLKLLLRYKKVIKNGNFDLVITYTVKPNIYGGAVCRYLKVPYAANITGLGYAFEKNGMLRKFVVFLYKRALKSAKAVFFENQNDEDTFLSEKIIPENKACLTCGAGVDLKKFEFAEYPPEREKTVFLFMARVMRAKGIEELLYATKRLYNEGYAFKLNIIGGMEENYRKVLEECKDFLEYFGFQNDVKPFIKESDCVVLPSYYEGMSNTLLESAATGRPLITTDVHGCMEAVIDRKSGLLCRVKDGNDLYEKMKEFMALSYAEKKSYGFEGRKLMKKKFSKENVVNITVERLKNG